VPAAFQGAPISPYYGFDAGAPLDYFLPEDSREAIGHAEQVIEFVRLRNSGISDGWARSEVRSTSVRTS
jgi:hypothetical protein